MVEKLLKETTSFIQYLLLLVCKGIEPIVLVWVLAVAYSDYQIAVTSGHWFGLWQFLQDETEARPMFIIIASFVFVTWILYKAYEMHVERSEKGNRKELLDVLKSLRGEGKL